MRLQTMSNIASQPTVLHGEMEQTTRTTAPPTMRCLSCNSQAQWLPNGQLWCPQCKNTLEIRSQREQVEAKIGAAVGVILLIIGIAAWSQGTFDGFLYQFGLNAQPCAQNFFGTVMCGDDLEQFCRENYDADLNGDVCGEVLN